MSQVLQLKIALKNIRPPIWRRIQVKDDITFAYLHRIIQDSMGWSNYHLYEFDVNDILISAPYENIWGDEDDTNDSDGENAKEAELNQYLTQEKQRFAYTYDFGDNWEHTIELEKILPMEIGIGYPQCVKGKRACPPEDCGGAWGYVEILEILENKNHLRYKEILDWIGGPFDSEHFNVDEVNLTLAEYRKPFIV